MALSLFGVVLLVAAACARRRKDLGRWPLGGAAAGALLVGLSTVVPAGHVGVVDLFGRVSPVSRRSGVQVVNPLARAVLVSVKPRS